MVEGVDIDFTELPVQREKPAHNHTFSTEQIHAIDLEVSELLKKGVIRKAHHSNKEYISPIFVRPKKDNRWRMILNLKDLNKNVEYFHFKMETLKKRFGFSQSKLFFLLAGRERCIFFSTCKRIFTRIPKVLLSFFFLLLFSPFFFFFFFFFSFSCHRGKVYLSCQQTRKQNTDCERHYV